MAFESCVLGRVAVIAAIAGLATPVLADPIGWTPNAAIEQSSQNVFFFGGLYHRANIWDTLYVPVVGQHYFEDNVFLGVGYQHFFYQTDWGFNLGAELGLGARIDWGATSSLEGWAGAVARFDGLTLGDTWQVSPSVTFGVSVVTDYVGIERERAARVDKDIHMLFYLGPELAVTHLDNPNLEYFFRIQHRSGGYGVILSLDSSNAATIGVRLKLD